MALDKRRLEHNEDGIFIAAATAREQVEPGHIVLEDANGNRVTVTVAHWRRWPQLAEHFRPVADATDVGRQWDNGKDPGEDGNPPGA
jgi:hypothetical protein